MDRSRVVAFARCMVPVGSRPARRGLLLEPGASANALRGDSGAGVGSSDRRRTVKIPKAVAACNTRFANNVCGAVAGSFDPARAGAQARRPRGGDEDPGDSGRRSPDPGPGNDASPGSPGSSRGAGARPARRRSAISALRKGNRCGRETDPPRRGHIPRSAPTLQPQRRRLDHRASAGASSLSVDSCSGPGT